MGSYAQDHALRPAQVQSSAGVLGAITVVPGDARIMAEPCSAWTATVRAGLLSRWERRMGWAARTESNRLEGFSNCQPVPYMVRCTMRKKAEPAKAAEKQRQPPAKMPLVFAKTAAGGEPVLDWLKGLPKADRHAIGLDLMRAQYRWPVGMPLCRQLGAGLAEIRTDLSSNQTARVFICHHKGELVALHSCIKKTKKTDPDDIAHARKIMKNLE
jgi:phage-related protein